MPITISRRGFMFGSLATGAALQAYPALACEFFTGSLRVHHPWTRATRPGETTAIVCMLFDEVSEPDRLIGVESPVATGAAMGGEAAGPTVDFPILPGRDWALTEEGTHVLLTGLRHPLAVGREYPLRLTFEKSGVVSAQLSVDFPAA
jgi:copper(I)-binding protein